MDLDDVLARLAIDADFRRRVRIDPAGALAGYRLSADDLAAVQSRLGRLDGRGPDVTTLLAGDATGPAVPAQPGDLFDAMLARPGLADRIREDPVSVADEWGLPLAEVRRLGELEVAAPGTEPSLLNQRLSKSALFFGGGHAGTTHLERGVVAGHADVGHATMDHVAVGHTVSEHAAIKCDAGLGEHAAIKCNGVHGEHAAIKCNAGHDLTGGGSQSSLLPGRPVDGLES